MLVMINLVEQRVVTQTRHMEPMDLVRSKETATHRVSSSSNPFPVQTVELKIKTVRMAI